VKAVILAGGKGTRIAEESAARPKPLIEIGGRPILWHIMSGYAAHGITEFVICAGYKGYMLKEYFVNMLLHHADVEVDMVRREVSHLGANPPPW
jgi:glucose-1-phosphate cytidylyltransferase